MAGNLEDRDLLAVLAAVSEVHQPSTPSTFPELAVAVVAALVRSDVTSYNEVDPDSATLVAVVRPAESVFAGADRVLAERAHEHPLIDRIRRTGDGSARKITDVMPHAAFRGLALYHELYQRLGVEHQMAFTLPDPRPHITALAVNRADADDDFDECDRTMLNLLRPHLAQAHRRAREQALLSEILHTSHRGLRAAGAALLVLDGPTPVELTPGALTLLHAYFGPPPPHGGLPAAVARWVAAQAASPVPGQLVPPSRPASAERDGRRLLLRYLPGAEGPAALLLQERTVVPSVAELEKLGLTRREAEVLRLLVGGAGNADIAVRLGVAAGTVKKHLDNVYRKLGVFGRGEAVWAALDLLAGLHTPLGAATPESLRAWLHPALE